ncbi:hypothetical protein BDW71DRAFT_203437 [Aspergillus fruticulosus]
MPFYIPIALAWPAWSSELTTLTPERSGDRVNGQCHEYFHRCKTEELLARAQGLAVVRRPIVEEIKKQLACAQDLVLYIARASTISQQYPNAGTYAKLWRGN